VRIVSCNPTEVRDPDVPPPFSGYPVDDRSQWAAYWEEWACTHGEMHARFSALCEERGAPPLPELEFMHESPWLNLTLYPGEADYPRARPLGDTWHNLQTSVRATDAPYELPPQLAGREGPLVYLSLGSLGSADVELMQKLVDSLADAPYRVIVSKGPQHELLRLPDTMAGEEFLPQTSILPQVDAVITHGGNNTVTECFHFGKPMVVLPLFWDQYDNAQRVQETGYGLRLDTYGHAPEELLAAVDSVLGDEAMRGRLARASARLQAHKGTERAADRIEAVATRC
jgi:MGT family glycosyltransferase